MLLFTTVSGLTEMETETEKYKKLKLKRKNLQKLNWNETEMKKKCEKRNWNWNWKIFHNWNHTESVQLFSRNVADKETKKQRKKQRNRAKTIPRPPGTGVKIYLRKSFCKYN